MTKRLVACLGLGIAACLVGIAISGDLGGIIGLAIFSVFIWRWNGGGLLHKNGYQRSGAVMRPAATKSLRFGLIAVIMGIWAYAMVVAAAPKSISLTLAQATESGAEFLARYIPAVAIPSAIKMGGNSESALVIQHILFVGWALLIPVAIWIVIDVCIVHRRAWRRSVILGTPLQVVTLLLLPSIFFFAASMSVLYFGWWQSAFPGRYTFEKLGLAQAPLLALFLSGAVFTLRGMAKATNALSQRFPSRGPAEPLG